MAAWLHARRYQKVSLWGWALGSACTILGESYAISTALVRRREGESDDDYEKRVAAAKAEINAHITPLIHGIFQVRGAALGGAPLTQTARPRDRQSPGQGLWVHAALVGGS